MDFKEKVEKAKDSNHDYPYDPQSTCHIILTMQVLRVTLYMIYINAFSLILNSIVMKSHLGIIYIQIDTTLITINVHMIINVLYSRIQMSKR